MKAEYSCPRCMAAKWIPLPNADAYRCKWCEFTVAAECIDDSLPAYEWPNFHDLTGE